MSSERDTQIKIASLLCAGLGPTAIANQVRVSRNTVQLVKKCLAKAENTLEGEARALDRKVGSGGQQKVDLAVIKLAIEANPTKSMVAHAKDLGISQPTVSQAVKKEGGKSLVLKERSMLTPCMTEVHLSRCQGLLNNLKSAPAGCVIIFSDEKTWTVNQVRNRQNDRFITFGDPNGADIITTMKHAQSVMSLGFVASNGITLPLIWFPKGYRLTVTDYIDKLDSILIPWIKANFLDNNVVLQQDSAPAHTAKVTQDFLHSWLPFWPKEMWLPHSPDLNPLDFTFWPHVESKACRIHHPNFEALKTSVNKEWNAMSSNKIRNRCMAFRRHLKAIIEANGGCIEA